MPARFISLTNREQLKELLKTEDYVLVKASAGWCGPCKMITPYFEEYATEFLTDKLIVVKLDVDNGRDLASFLKIESIPMLLYFKNKQLESTITGADMGRLRRFLENILKDLS